MQNTPLSTALWFYSGADYLIVNALLWRNTQALEACLKIVWDNNRAVIREARQSTPEKRFSGCGLDAAALYESYLSRTPEAFTEEAKHRMIDQAILDIRCICSAMQSAEEDLQLIRNVDARFAIGRAAVGETVELLGLTSTSTTGQLIDYGKNEQQKPDQILRIRVPAGLPALRLEDDREREVLLPPMAYRVLDRRTENGADTLWLEAVKPLNLEQLICAAKSEWEKRRKC